jgi:hypothetical protein
MTTKISSGSKIQPLREPIETLTIGKAGTPGELLIYGGKLYVYSATGDTLIEAGLIQTGAIIANSITADKLTIGSQSFINDIVWTATDENSFSWSAGTITFADESTASILTGSANITAKTYVYYDGTTTLKTSTDSDDSIGDSVVLLAIVEVGVTLCIITPIKSSGTFIDGNRIITGRIQSADGKTYFDLDTGEIMVNDGTYNRLIIGVI